MSKQTPSEARKNRRFFQYSTLALLLAGIIASATTAKAAQYPHSERPALYKADLATIANIDTRVLDWRTQTVDVYFDLPETDWIDDLELLMSARPDGNVSPRMPLMVRFNGGQAIPVHTKGFAFDARIKLNAARVRPRNNKITFEYRRPAGYACLSEENGAWTLDLSQSVLVAKARAKSRPFTIAEIEERFTMPAAAPQSIALLAKGQQAVTLQALAAQGVGLRADELPDFTFAQNRADMEIIMGRRDQLTSLVTDKKILSETGARVSVHEGRPMRLVLTGDTDAEVLSMAKAFAQHELPHTRRTQTNIGEVLMQPSHEMHNVIVDASTKLSQIPGQTIGQDWGQALQYHDFKVSDPQASSGKVLLRLAGSDNLSDDSQVAVKLNGEHLGYTLLNRARKSVEFPIKPGTLRATENRLEILPTLQRNDEAETCGYDSVLPGFVVGSGSKIDLKVKNASPLTELSRFAATGAPFSGNYGADTVVVLSSGNAKHKAASMKVLSQLAKTSGHSWTEASVNIAADLDADISTDFAGKNILLIGPKTAAMTPLVQAGPKSLTAALRGDTLRSGAAFQTASIQRFASSDNSDVLRAYAARQSERGQITRGGVAALYPSPFDDGRMVGLITASTGYSFPVSADQIIEANHWNQLGGSVARWDADAVLMAQTAVAESPAMRLANAQTPSSNAEWANKLWGDAVSEAGRLSTAAAMKTAELRAIVKDRFSRPLQADQSPAAAPVQDPTSDPVADVKPRLKPIQVADASALPAPALRGLSKAPMAPSTIGTKIPDANWTGVKTRFDQSAEDTQRWVQNAWTYLTTDRPATTPTTSLKTQFKQMTSGSRSYANKSLQWIDTKMSRPALVVMIAFFLLLGLLGLASATDRTGNHH